jgi:hypothetical protein
MKSNNRKANRRTVSKNRSERSQHIAILKIHYKFLILLGVLVLAGIAIFLGKETPVIWTFLYGIGGWAALTTNPTNLR